MSSKSKDPTRQQLSSRLHYNARVPAFLQKLQNRVAGVPDDEPELDEEYGYGRDEYEYVNDGSGRPPIPRRPPIPERPADDPGSAAEDEDDEDRDGEAPQIVVLKEGKHLNEREVENERRKAKGLSPLLDEIEEEIASSSKKDATSSKAKAKTQSQSLSFSSSGSNPKQSSKKRKIVGDPDTDEKDGKASKKASKKPKKAQRKLLSFGDDA
ncbi:hypothetical protein BDY19DRAFT_992491 [Irpex rosettiformis]|uniref:Uncharacterized protein n=1 Tax=Irpex rosettiformis TaxID=378272 RepID=A0ACB8U7P4_9APHY|nr:hypothetical protein BDY19DRAFT_992491 [Irpex rosettiformis]